MAKKDKATSVEKQKTPSNSISPKDKPATLIEAILALGGSQEDFDLVGGDHSDIEPDRAPAKNQKQSEKNSDKDVNLDKDLKALVDGLGFDKLDRDFEPELESEQSDDDEPPSQQSEPPEVLNQHEAEQVQTQPSTKPEETAVLDKLKPPTGLWVSASYLHSFPEDFHSSSG